MIGDLGGGGGGVNIIKIISDLILFFTKNYNFTI